MAQVKIGNKILTLEKTENKNEIHFSLSDNNKIYELEEELFEFDVDDLLKNTNNFEFKINENPEQNEMKLTIKSKKNGKTKTSILNCKNINDSNNNFTTVEPAPVIKSGSTSHENEWEKKIEEIKNNYNNTIKEIKEKNKQLMKENEELQKEIDKEKRKSDEIFRVYIENREKYENAVKKNSEIAELQSKL